MGNGACVYQNPKCDGNKHFPSDENECPKFCYWCNQAIKDAKRNTGKEKEKKNKGFPYKRGGTKR